MDNREMTIWVGTYSEQGGGGLHPIRLQPSGESTVEAPFEGAKNASFGLWSTRHQLCYLVDEQADCIRVLRWADGWSQVAAVPAGGSKPCYLALSSDETRLAVANYGNGSIALFSLDPATGQPAAAPEIWSNSGKGAAAERQDGPHAHCVIFSPDQRWLYQVDLGTDEILAFSVDRGLGGPQCAFRAPPASGPRHLLLHPNGRAALLISEMASTIHLLSVKGGRFEARQLLSTLPTDWRGDSLGGHIGMNSAGDRIYVTNRGHDSIATFEFDGERLTLLQHASSGGSSPRHFLILEDERLILVAHEKGGGVSGFRIQDDGTLKPAGMEIAVPGAVFLLKAPQ
jgi:6-phosphogluconolactonase